MVQNRSKSVKFGPKWSKTGENRSKMVENRSKSVKIVHNWSKTVKFGPKWPKIGESPSTMVKIGPKWAISVQNRENPKISLRRHFFFSPWPSAFQGGGPKVPKVQIAEAPFSQKVQISLVQKMKTLVFSLFYVLKKKNLNFWSKKFLAKSSVPLGTKMAKSLGFMQTAMKKKKVTP